MPRSDSYRPAAHQIRSIYRCMACQREDEFLSDQTVEGGRCPCGGVYTFAGESYPADVDDWEEQRDPDGEWRERRR